MRPEENIKEILNTPTKTSNVPSRHRSAGLEEALIMDNTENPISREDMAKAIQTLKESVC